MNLISKRLCAIICLGILISCFMLASPPAHSQEDTTAEAAASDPIADLQEQLAGANQRLARAQEAATPERAAQLGVPLEDLQRKVNVVQEIVFTLERHIETVRNEQRFAEQKQVAEEEAAAFEGFPEPPPYTILFLDGLLANLASTEFEIESAKQQIQYSKESVDRAKKRLAEAQGRLAGAQDSARFGAPTPQTEWEAGLYQAQIDLEQANVAAAEAQVVTFNARLAALEVSRTFAQEKAEIARENTIFTQAQLDEKLAAIGEKRAAVEKLVEEAATQRDRADRALRGLQQQLDAARASAATEADVQRLTDQVTRQRLLVENAARLYETRLATVKTYTDEEQLWRIRMDLLRNTGDTPSRENRQQLEALQADVDQARQMFIAGMTSVRSAVAAQGQVENQPPLTDAEIQQREASFSALEAAYADALVRAFELQQLASRVAEEVDTRLNTADFGQRYQRAKEAVVRWWNYPLTSVEDNPLTLGKIIIAFLIFLAGMVLVHVGTHWFRGVLTKRMHVEESAAIAVSKGIYYFLAAIVVYYALFVVQIPLTVFTFLGGALAIGVGFGAQNLINNFISGLILLVERPIKIGDIVEVDTFGGRIVNVGARCSQLHTFTGYDVLIPNSHFLEQKVINWTHADAKVRFSVAVGVDYGSPTRDVAQLIMDAVKEHGRILEDPVPVVLFKDFGDSALAFEAYFWVDISSGVDPRVVQSDLRHRIGYLLEQAGIGIPFPQRTVHFTPDKPIAVRVVQDDEEEATDEK